MSEAKKRILRVQAQPEGQDAPETRAPNGAWGRTEVSG